MEVSIKLNYIIISMTAFLISVVGSLYAITGMRWYDALNLPSYTPSSLVFGAGWTTIYVLTAAAAILVWNRFERDRQFWAIIALFVLNAILNVLWPYLFFYKHTIGFALIDAVALFVTVLLSIVMIGQRSLFAASLLAPYLGWMSFAIFLNVVVWWTN